MEKIVFPPYGKEDLIKIVEQRVGTRTFDGASLQLAGRKIAAASGDARAMLNLASNAIRKYQEIFNTESEYNKICPSTMEPLITLKHMMKAVRETVGKKQTNYIESLPQAAKFVLCIAVTIGKIMGTDCVMSMAKLKRYCAAATRNGMLDSLSLEHFIEVIDLLIDSGLLLVGGDDRFVDQAGERLLRLGVQFDDVECALETTLLQQEFFQNMVKHMKEELAREKY